MEASSGLSGIEVCETELSDVDGEAGALVIRGYPVEELAASKRFEDVTALLWDGALPTEDERRALERALGERRVRAFARLAEVGDALDLDDGMDALRAAAAHLPVTGSDREDALSVTAALPVFAAAWARRRHGEKPVAPDATRSHAADYLRMLWATEPSTARVVALNRYLCTVIDHGMNASTFTARVVASTESDTISAVVAALGALKGKLHGGAPGPVLDMLDAIGSAERARGYLERELAQGRRIMGLGHRVYRVRDPRASALERAVEELGNSSASNARLELARTVEREAVALLAERRPERRLRANVEFYTAVLLEAIGVRRELFTPTFAVGRVAGWCAHIAEQRRSRRIIRPSSRYVGPRPAAARTG